MMMKTVAIGVMGVLWVCGSADEGLADKPDFRHNESWGIAGIIAWHDYSSQARLGAGQSSSVGSSVLLGARFWRRLWGRVTLEAELPLGTSNSRDRLATLFLTQPRGQARVRVISSPLAAAGVVLGTGASIVTSNRQNSVLTDIEPMAYGGIGGDLTLKGIRFGVDLRYVLVRGFGDLNVAHQWESTLSVAFVPSNRRSDLALLSDGDGDGVPDSEDACPERSEDLDGTRDLDGCPELDNDNDGVIDGLDECPGAAESHNGFEDNDGCPDVMTEEILLLEGVIRGLPILSGIGKIAATNSRELELLVAVLKSAPSVKIVLAGHTDDRETTRDQLVSLSFERSVSVRQYLIDAGVGPGRILVVGRGAAEPIASNDTKGGRRVNRRVEIQINRK